MADQSMTEGSTTDHKRQCPVVATQRRTALRCGAPRVIAGRDTDKERTEGRAFTSVNRARRGWSPPFTTQDTTSGISEKDLRIAKHEARVRIPPNQEERGESHATPQRLWHVEALEEAGVDVRARSSTGKCSPGSWACAERPREHRKSYTAWATKRCKTPRSRFGRSWTAVKIRAIDAAHFSWRHEEQRMRPRSRSRVKRRFPHTNGRGAGHEQRRQRR
jgi:hypothetical protein